MRISDWISDVCSSDLCRRRPVSWARARPPAASWPKPRNSASRSGTRPGCWLSSPNTDERVWMPKTVCHGSEPMSDWQPSATFDALRLRARLNAAVREFFAQRGVLEVETPVMSQAGNTEPNIASFAPEFSGRTDGGPRTRWPRTPSEYPLKRLPAAGPGPFYDHGS